MILAFTILGVTILLLLINKLPMELTALLSMLALYLTGLVTVDQALSGFANPTVITIAALFVVGGGLFHTGVADWTARKMIDLIGDDPMRFTLALIVITAVFSAFMSNTGTVAVLIPAVVSAARRMNLSPARFLMPMAFAAQLGGLLTLVGTPPNIVIANTLRANNLPSFGFFEFSLLGIPLLILYMLYAVGPGRKFAKGRDDARQNLAQEITTEELVRAYDLSDRFFKLRIRKGSKLIGRTLIDAELDTHQLHLLHLAETTDAHAHHHHPLDRLRRVLQQEPHEQELPIDAQTKLKAHHLLYITGEPSMVNRFALKYDLGVRPIKDSHDPNIQLDTEIGFAELLLTQRSQLNGRTIRSLEFSKKYNVRVLGIQHNGVPRPTPFIDTKLAFGDSLLIYGRWGDITRLRSEIRNFIVVGRPDETLHEPKLSRESFIAIAALAGMVVMMLTKIAPTVMAAMITAVVMIAFRCLKPEEAYSSISWQSLILIAAMLPMSAALKSTGGAEFVADSLVSMLGGGSPIILLAGMYLLTMVFSQFISNTATTILVAPIAMQTAQLLGLSPEPILMMVAAGASSAFLTPIASPVNMLVLAPGGYRFGDFAKAGLPLMLIVLAASLVIVPLIWPV